MLTDSKNTLTILIQHNKVDDPTEIWSTSSVLKATKITILEIALVNPISGACNDPLTLDTA